MTFQEIRTRIQVLCKLGGWDNVDPPPDYAFLANAGVRQFSLEAQANQTNTTVTTVADQSEYALTTTAGSWLNIQDASYGTDQPLYKSTESQRRRENPLWFQDASGQPVYYWMVGSDTIKLWPPPSTAGVTIYLRGTQMDPVLTNDTDTPLSPIVFHEAICLFGAWFHGKSYCYGEEKSRAAMYRKEALDIVDKYSENLSAQDDSCIIRRVAKPPVRYTFT